jgi:hypothetical protein
MYIVLQSTSAFLFFYLGQKNEFISEQVCTSWENLTCVPTVATIYKENSFAVYMSWPFTCEL